MVRLLNLLVLLFAMASAGCEHTTTYSKFDGPGNANNRYYIASTYNAGGQYGECTDLGSNSDVFKRKVDKTVCVGVWCSPDGNRGNGWGCKDAARECYEVEHIIPTANDIPELRGCNVNIFGNAVMAYGVWNGQLSDGYLCEKQEVYGTIYNSAYNAVLGCCGRVPSSPSSRDVVLIVVVPVAVMMVIVAVGICLYYRKRPIRADKKLELVELVQ